MTVQTNLKSILAGALLLGFLIISISQNVNKQPQLICNQNENCIYNLILDSNNSNYCSQLTTQNNQQQECFKTFAYQFKNTTLCQNTNNQSLCVQNIAVQNNNLGICNNLQDQNNSNNCIFQIAIKNLNETICETSSDVGRCYYSYALSTNNSKLCNLTQKYQNLCENKLY